MENVNGKIRMQIENNQPRLRLSTISSNISLKSEVVVVSWCLTAHRHNNGHVEPVIPWSGPIPIDRPSRTETHNTPGR